MPAPVAGSVWSGYSQTGNNYYPTFVVLQAFMHFTWTSYKPHIDAVESKSGALENH